MAARQDFYPWLKALHVIAIIAWMAGMLYLPRLFVYHCEAEPGSSSPKPSSSWSGGCSHVIINPAMVVELGARLWLAWEAGLFASRVAPRQSWAGSDAVGAARLHGRAGCVISLPTRTSILKSSIALSMKYRRSS